MQTVERLTSLMQHLGLEAAHFATQVPGDVAGLAAGVAGADQRPCALRAHAPRRSAIRPCRVAPAHDRRGEGAQRRGDPTRARAACGGAAACSAGLRRLGLVGRGRRPNRGGCGHHHSVPGRHPAAGPSLKSCNERGPGSRQRHPRWPHLSHRGARPGLDPPAVLPRALAMGAGAAGARAAFYGDPARRPPHRRRGSPRGSRPRADLPGDVPHLGRSHGAGGRKPYPRSGLRLGRARPPAGCPAWPRRADRCGRRQSLPVARGRRPRGGIRRAHSVRAG